MRLIEISCIRHRRFFDLNTDSGCREWLGNAYDRIQARRHRKEVAVFHYTHAWNLHVTHLLRSHLTRWQVGRSLCKLWQPNFRQGMTNYRIGLHLQNNADNDAMKQTNGPAEQRWELRSIVHIHPHTPSVRVRVINLLLHRLHRQHRR